MSRRSPCRVDERGAAVPALGTAVGSDFKGKISVAIYAVAIPLSFANRWLAFGLYVFVAAMWFVADRRIERVIGR